MKTQTSLVAQQVRLQQWMELIRDCQNRPVGTSVDDWCQQNGITKSNYYYKMRRIREAYLANVPNQESQFIELPKPTSTKQGGLHLDDDLSPSNLVAILRSPTHHSLEIYSTTTPELMKSLIGAFTHAE